MNQQEAQKYRLPVVSCRPWATLIERILDVVGTAIQNAECCSQVFLISL